MSKGIQFLLPPICQEKDFINCHGLVEKDYAKNVFVSDALTNAVLMWNSVLRDLREEDSTAVRLFQSGMGTSWGDYANPPTATKFCAFLVMREKVLSGVSHFYTNEVEAALRVLAHRNEFDEKSAQGLREFVKLRKGLQSLYEEAYDAVKYVVQGTLPYVEVLETSLDAQDVIDTVRPLLGALRMVWFCSTSHGQTRHLSYSAYLSRIVSSLWSRADSILRASLVQFCSGSTSQFAQVFVMAKTKALAVEEICVMWAEAADLPLGGLGHELSNDLPTRLTQRCREALHTMEILRGALSGIENKESTAYLFLEETRESLPDMLTDVKSFLDPFESLLAWKAVMKYVVDQVATVQSNLEAKKKKEQEKGSKIQCRGTSATTAPLELRSSEVKTKALGSMLLIMVTLNPPAITVVGPVKAVTLDRLADRLPNACATVQGGKRDLPPKFERRVLLQTLQQQNSITPCVDHCHVMSLLKYHVVEDAYFLLMILDIVEMEGGWVLRDGDASVEVDSKTICHKLLFQRKRCKDHQGEDL